MLSVERKDPVLLDSGTAMFADVPGDGTAPNYEGFVKSPGNGTTYIGGGLVGPIWRGYSYVWAQPTPAPLYTGGDWRPGSGVFKIDCPGSFSFNISITPCVQTRPCMRSTAGSSMDVYHLM